MKQLLLLLLCRFSCVWLCATLPALWQPTRLLHPWDSPGKNTGVGCHFLLHKWNRVLTISLLLNHLHLLIIHVIFIYLVISLALLVAQTVKNLPAIRETQVHSLGLEGLLEKGMATHSNVLTWRIPWTEEPGVLQSMGSQRDPRWLPQRTSQLSFFFWSKLDLWFPSSAAQWPLWTLLFLVISIFSEIVSNNFPRKQVWEVTHFLNSLFLKQIIRADLEACTSESRV